MTEFQVTVMDGVTTVKTITAMSPEFDYTLGPSGTVGSGLLTTTYSGSKTFTDLPTLAEYTERAR